MIATLIRTCCTCDKPIRGRTDKKFCDDQCRNSYHNRLNSEGSNYMRNIGNRLKRNRKILQAILDRKRSMRVNIDMLNTRGFSFMYCTHTLEEEAGEPYRFCFEYGYRRLGNELVQLVHRKEI